MQELLKKIWKHYYKDKEFPAGKDGKLIPDSPPPPPPQSRDPELAEKAKRAIFDAFYKWDLDIIGRDFETKFLPLLVSFNENNPKGSTIPLEKVQQARQRLPRNDDERSHAFFRIFHLIIFPVMDFYPEDFCWANRYWPRRLDVDPSDYCFAGKEAFRNCFRNRGIDRTIFRRIAPSLAVWLTGSECPRAFDAIRTWALRCGCEDAARFYCS